MYQLLRNIPLKSCVSYVSNPEKIVKNRRSNKIIPKNCMKYTKVYSNKQYFKFLLSTRLTYSVSNMEICCIDSYAAIKMALATCLAPTRGTKEGL